MNTSKTRLILLGIAAGVLLALLLAPQTRWLVRLQALTVLHQYRPIGCESYSRSAAGDARAYDGVAARHPEDFATQYARAGFDGDTALLTNLRALTRRFPNSPVLYANILRDECGRLHSVRPDSNLLQNQPVPSDVSHLPVPTSEELAAYDQEAGRGERIDPANAYFPLMRAFGLFAAHRDAEALAAVKRASIKPQWNEYLTENVEAKWGLHTEAFGDPGAMPQAMLWSGELLPQYQRLRDTARIGVYQAVLKEQAGNREEGYQLREALRRCGDLMRVQSTTMIGSLVGIAISAISEARPGGSPYLLDNTDAGGQMLREQWTGEQMAQKRLERYCAYVVQIGHPEAAQRAQDEEKARRTIQGLTEHDPQMLNYVAPLWRLIFWWMAGVALLLNAVLLLGLGLVAAGLARRTLAPKPPIRWQAVLLHCLLGIGAWLVLAMLFICVSGVWITLVYHTLIDWQMTIGVAGVFSLAAWLVGYGLHHLPRPHRVSVLKIAILLPALVGITYGISWLAQWLAWPLAEIPQGMLILTGKGYQDPSSGIVWVCVAATLAVPLLLAFVLGLTALTRRLPLFRTLTAGFQRLAVPLACLLVVAYGGVLVGTLRQERLVTAFNRRIVSEGGRFFAAQAGKSWPGPVR